MFKLFISLLFLLFAFNLFLPKSAFAAEQFAESYVVRFEVQDNGDAFVSEKVTIRNLTDIYFGSNYKSIIPTQTLMEVSARDASRELPVEVKSEGDKSAITVTFPEQIIGKDKQYSWTLSYRLPDFVQRNGRISTFSIPKVSEIKNLEQYDLSVSIHLSLGEPTQLLPKPVSQKDVNDRTEYYFNGNIISITGISGLFGNTQYYQFGLDYELENNSLLPAIKSVLIPGNNAQQEIIIKEIEPKPENVITDEDGNTRAFFKLGRLEKIQVLVKGEAKIDLEKIRVKLPTVNHLNSITTANQIWDSDSPQVQQALKVALENKENISELEKAERIFGYVVSVFEQEEMLPIQQVENNSASSILNNSDSSDRISCLDYVHLTIALLRAAKIPAEQVVGIVNLTNDKAACFSNGENSPSNLHTWIRFYDNQKGWVNVDPVWGITGGLAYFAFNDLEHITVGSLTTPINISELGIKKNELAVTEEEFLPIYNLKTEIISPAELIAGFPYEITLRISNEGNSLLPPGEFSVAAKQLNLKPKNGENNGVFLYPYIPPLGYIDYVFTTKSGIAWKGFSDQISIIDQGTVLTTKNILVKPIFSSRFFSVIVIGLTFLMLGLYFLAIYLHYKSKTIFEAADDLVEEVTKVVAPVISTPAIKIATSGTKNVVKAVKKTKAQKFRRKKK